ncbi:MAG TPA: hypothetical protein VLR90_19360 [Blastocatellia bacterium]|nr:hypothetical protein [Blastocatellia bacterium]
MLPEFNFDGNLPPGVHHASLIEIENRFGEFTISDHRIRLFSKFKQLVEMAKFSGVVKRIIIGGSFVSAKPVPNDIDVVIVLAKDVEIETLAHNQHVVADRDALRRVLRGDDIDPKVVREETPGMQTIIEFFQSNRDNKAVGVVEVDLYGNS